MNVQRTPMVSTVVDEASVCAVAAAWPPAVTSATEVGDAIARLHVRPAPSAADADDADEGGADELSQLRHADVQDALDLAEFLAEVKAGRARLPD